MLIENLDKEGLTFITNVLGETSEKGVWAYRGDLVLIQGSFREGSATDRKPPELLLRQTAILADSEKFIFLNGLFDELQHISIFIEKYKAFLTPDTLTLFYVENIEIPMQIELEGVTFRLLPYKEGMVWNETMETLYIEKADLKGQSAEDKVVTVYEAAKSYKAKGETLSFEDALGKTIVVKKAAAVGPI
ncbi:hypothetical protein [Methylomonas methanica]|uniref:Uncharacterized protein n=1 Tax=Methylomonas methanica (strain DSM 25384 / MC09) TaxID=857087 RepID=F9ZZ09_METMM|nr:hypothetical protein [Methylomonas methanica]AEF99864.1 hypothetical protein Metme_1441 [Methylomonas methanica MC09]